MGDDPVPSLTRSQLAEAFSNSTLPFKVDVVYCSDVSLRFREEIKKTSISFASVGRRQRSKRLPQIVPAGQWRRSGLNDLARNPNRCSLCPVRHVVARLGIRALVIHSVSPRRERHMAGTTLSTKSTVPASEEAAPPAATANGSRQPRQPEKKIGPFAGGVGVAIWLNQIELQDGGSRMVRSITVAPRRYFDKESNQWKDAGSYNPSDLPALIFALTQAQAYCYTVPLPGESEPGGTGEPRDDVPF